jgi:hypothetical protein
MGVLGTLFLIAPFGIERNMGIGLGSLIFSGVTFKVNYDKLKGREPT